MKKYLICLKNEFFGKTLKIMKISFFLFFVGVFQVFAANNYAQSQKLTLSMENTTIADALQAIEDQSEFKFFYNNQLIDVDKVVTVKSKKENIWDVLNQILPEADITFRVVGKQVALFSKALVSDTNVLLQPQTITGKVTDETGSPLPGVSILVKDTFEGVITDASGDFIITVDNPDAILVFSFIGYHTQEIPVGNQSTINLTLVQETFDIEEVVAIGYGTARKNDLTGAISTVNEDELASRLNVNLLQSLQGSAAGLSVNTNNFRPGEDPAFLIRGVNSLSSSNKPLVILDGIPYEGDITSINPTDVESVSILKDASSTAIYGARAANGVIIISTKKGRGKTQINFETLIGMSSMANKIPMLNGEDYEAYLIDYNYRMDVVRNPNAVPRDIESILNAYAIPQWEAGTTTDWQDLIYKTALQQNYNLSLSGSSDKTSYYTSLGYLDQQGIHLDSEFKRISLRSNIDHNLNEWLKVGLNTQLSHSDYGNITPMTGQILEISPYGKLYDDFGGYERYPQYPEEYIVSPFANEGATKKDVKRQIITNFFGELSPGFLPGLSYRINFGNYLSDGDLGRYYPSYTLTGHMHSGVAEISRKNTSRWTWENIVKYDKEFGKHKINLVGLYSREHSMTRKNSTVGKEFINDVSLWHQMDAANIITASSSISELALESLMGRLNYNYSGKYFLTATIRRDGYSGFGVNQKYGNFPSVALGWTISNESFFQNSSALSTFDFLKLRLSWGANGNMAIPPYYTLDQFTNVEIVYGDNETIHNGFITQVRGNPDLRWESFQSYNFALDFSLLKNRISGTVDYFTGKSDGLLMNRTIPMMNGISSVYENIGETLNNGMDFSLNTVNVQRGDFKWTTSINFQMTRDEITKLRGDGKDDINNEWFIGEPINVHYDYVQTGIFQIDDDFTIQPYDQPGNPKIMDVDNSGFISTLDKIVHCSALPKWSAGIINRITYKNWELSIFVNTVQGIIKVNELVNPTKWSPGKNVNYIDIDFWMTDNPTSKYLAPSYEDLYVTKIKILEDASFIKIQDVSLMYNVPKQALSKIGIKSLRLYVTGHNLYTFTNWIGYDPETSSTAGAYPSARTIAFGLKIGL